ncbi:hypothetical protein PENPOL_c015G08019 [Penicillium polonicum]|uniref:Uncharacterized protein n=1 Tax=Penicillium polonicum TaxID=60169 RepID=A0A1V6NAR3_PENPO|nr:hypothetical protein PENPOL_c015G08019 [Penicillium polonicum]
MEDQHPANTLTTPTPTPTPRGIGNISICDIALPESIIIYLEQDSSTLQTMERLYRLGVATKLPALHRAASRLEALAAVCKSNFAARMLLQSTHGPISNQDATALWTETMPELPQPSQYWTVVISLLLSQEDRMALRDALRFVAGLHAFNEAVQELDDGMEKSLFIQLADKWFEMLSEEENYTEDNDTEEELEED